MYCIITIMFNGKSSYYEYITDCLMLKNKQHAQTIPPGVGLNYAK